MKFIKHFAVLIAGLFVFAACQKEYSVENGGLGGLAEGTLKDSLGDCSPITLRGVYFSDSTLSDSNYIIVQANITAPGAYKIFTDTQNGYSFSDSGYFSALGLVSVKLKTIGRPILPITSDFTLSFGSTSFCVFSVPVLPNPNGNNNTAAAFTLSGTPANCTNAIVQGSYVAGTALNNSNTVDIEVNVTAPGFYQITTTATNGMTFSRTSAFTTTGIQRINLQGTGTPTAASATAVPITAGGTSCSFTVNVVPGSPGDINQMDSAWQFTQGFRTFHGTIDSVAFAIPTGSPFYALQLIGFTAATGDTAFIMGIAMTGNTIKSGNYNTTFQAAFNFSNAVTNATIFKADPSTLIPPVDIAINLSYDATTKIAQGTFLGSAQNSTSGSVTIANGKFKVLVP